MELKHTQSTIFNSSSSLVKTSTFFVQRCKLHFQRISWKSRDKKSSVHVVKRDETLTSISKLYGIPILEIPTANKDNMDGDLVFEGHPFDFNSPTTTTFTQVCHFEGEEGLNNKLSKTGRDSGFHGKEWNQIVTKPSYHHLFLAKATGSFLLLVALIAFCIRCTMMAAKSRNARDFRDQKAQKSSVQYRTSKSMRWKTALSDLRDPDATDAEYEPDSAYVPDNEDQLHNCGDHTKLEAEYQKFLSECGMSEWGYWRGGSST